MCIICSKDSDRGHLCLPHARNIRYSHNYGSSLTFTDNNMEKVNEDVQSLLITCAAYIQNRTDIIRNVNNLAHYNKAAVNGIFK